MADIITLHTAEAGAKPGFCHTPTAVAILSALTGCHTNGKMGCIFGGPGVGKTTAIDEYARERDDVTVCRMIKAAAKMQPGLVRIVSALGGYAAPQMGSADLYEEAVRRLRTFPRKLLILDEAQRMDDDLLEMVRDLFDEGRAGIMLVGSRELPERWEAKSAAKRRKWAQLTSRLTVRYDIPTTSSDDIAALCDHHAIADKCSRDLLSAAASGDGGLRNVTTRIDIARKMAGGEAIALSHLEDAERVLGAR